MAIRMVFMLFALCAVFGTSYQKRNSLRERLDFLQMKVDSNNVKTQTDIYELREAVDLLCNNTEGNSPSIASVSSLGDATITRIESKMKYQGMKIITISKAVSDEKTYTRDQMNEMKQINDKLTQQVQGLTIDMLQVKEELDDVKTYLTEAKQTNTELKEELHAVKEDLTETKETKEKQKKQIKENKEEISLLRELITEMNQKIKDLQPSTTTSMTTQPTTTEPSPTTEPELLSTKVVVSTCPDGWEKFQDTCYLHVKTAVNWDEANRKCNDRGGFLAEADTEEKHMFLLQIIGNTENTWLGGTDRHTEGTWVWSGSERPMVYCQWYPGQPNSNGNEDCLVMIGNTGWHDYRCSGNWFRYICEKRPMLYIH